MTVAKRRYTVIFSGELVRKIAVIKSIFSHTHLGLRESKELLDSTVEKGVEGSVETTKKKSAVALVQALHEQGLTARYVVNPYGLGLVKGDTSHEEA